MPRIFHTVLTLYHSKAALISLEKNFWRVMYADFKPVLLSYKSKNVVLLASVGLLNFRVILEHPRCQPDLYIFSLTLVFWFLNITLTLLAQASLKICRRRSRWIQFYSKHTQKYYKISCNLRNLISTSNFLPRFQFQFWFSRMGVSSEFFARVRKMLG